MPECPENYECTFTPDPPSHFYEHWWDGPFGIAVAIVAIVAVVVIVWVAIYWIATVRKNTRDAQYSVERLEAEEREMRAKQNHQLLMAEQLTMQLDTAKDNPEMLLWIDRHTKSIRK